MVKGWAGMVGGSAAASAAASAGTAADSEIKGTGATGMNGEQAASAAAWEDGMRNAGVERSWVPVFEESDYSPERLAERYVKYMDSDGEEGFVSAYRDILDNGGEAYRKILLYLAALDVPASGSEEVAGDGGGETEAQGALIHCTAGKDRTGIFFGVLFDFLGVERTQIAKEYQLTERGLAHIREAVVERLLASPGFKKFAGGVDGDEVVAMTPKMKEKGRAAALRMIGAREGSMLAALEMVDSVFGGSERYLREKCGLGDGELERLKRNLVVGGGAR